MAKSREGTMSVKVEAFINEHKALGMNAIAEKMVTDGLVPNKTKARWWIRYQVVTAGRITDLEMTALPKGRAKGTVVSKKAIETAFVPDPMTDPVAETAPVKEKVKRVSKKAIETATDVSAADAARVADIKAKNLAKMKAVLAAANAKKAEMQKEIDTNDLTSPDNGVELPKFLQG